MKFEEIFNIPGYYKTNTTDYGTCYKVTNHGELLEATFEDPEDSFPNTDIAVCSKELFSMDFTKVDDLKEIFK